MFEVVYYSFSGNTRKVAEAIAAELKVRAQDVRGIDSLPRYSNVILGTGCYGGSLPGEVTEFLKRCRIAGGHIALFTTSAFGVGKELDNIERQLNNRGIDVTARFDCGGQFLMAKRGHPTTEELEQARRFARCLATAQYTVKFDSPGGRGIPVYQPVRIKD
jgi:flavodoxin